MSDKSRFRTPAVAAIAVAALSAACFGVTAAAGAATSSTTHRVTAASTRFAPSIPSNRSPLHLGSRTRIRGTFTPGRPGTSTAARPDVLIGTYPGYNFPADIDSYTSAVGMAPDIVEWFQSWDEPLYWSKQQAGINARNVTPLITWSPGSSFSPAKLASGGYDSYITAQAQAAKAWKRPLMIRPFHEMNGTWNSYGYTKQTPAQFVAGWRHIVDIFRAQGVTNVSWVWSPNIYGFGQTVPFDAYYPGDAYVDWTALDGYNFPGTWRSFATLFSGAYADITKLTTKPLMVAEWGCSSTGGDKAAWIRDAFAQLPTAMPRVRAMVSFDKVRESDFRINSSADVLSAYRGVVGLVKGVVL